MNNELAFRIGLAAIFLAVLAIRLYYMALAIKSSVDTMATNQLGTIRSFLIRGVIVLAILLPGIYLIVPSWLEWAALWVPAGLRWIGVGAGALGVLLLLWVHRTLGHNFAMPGIIQTQQTLVTSGPYHWIQHPMYTSFALIALAGFLISANWFIALAGFGYFAGALSAVKKEEATLIVKFGNLYREYMRRTGRFLPRFR